MSAKKLLHSNAEFLSAPLQKNAYKKISRTMRRVKNLGIAEICFIFNKHAPSLIRDIASALPRFLNLGTYL